MRTPIGKKTNGLPGRTPRQQASDKKRHAILEAALDVFAAHGYASARLDDVAEKAGVAKGTIYLFFDDKEALFEQLLIGAVAPVLAKMEGLANEKGMAIDEVLGTLFSFFRTEVLGTKRREVIRLVITEGHRFPRIAEIYHREVIAKGLALLSRVARSARARGALPTDDLIDFPHLMFAPLVMSLVWEGLFSRTEPLDVEGLLDAHRRLLTGTKSTTRKRKG